jgi:hypothetical protein
VRIFAGCAQPARGLLSAGRGQRNPVMHHYKQRDKKLATEKSSNYPIHPSASYEWDLDVRGMSIDFTYSAHGRSRYLIVVSSKAGSSFQSP